MLTLRNQGLIGTDTSEWVPGGPIGLSDAVPVTATDVVIMLGTNDRGSTVQPRTPSKISDNIEAMVTWLQANRPGVRIILMSNLLCRNAQEQGGGGTFYFHSSEGSRAIARLAQRKSLGFIDVYGRTAEEALKGTNYLISDDIHFSDAGHMAIFDLWIERLGVAP